jgi:2-iminobutanoate/2-iminopropanoate deaminase
MRDAIWTDRIAAPIGPFSAGVVADGTIFVSGQVGQDPATGKLVTGGVTAEAEQALRNLAAVLAARGRSLDHVTRVGIFLTSMTDFPAVNEVYARHFRSPYPARTTVGVAALPLGAGVEIDAIAE